MTNTYSTIQTKIISFEDNWHLPTLSLVNQAHRSGTPSALLEAVKHTDQAITALEHLQTSVALLVQRDGSTITPQEACALRMTLKNWLVPFNTSRLSLESLP
ncbi:hypothetical protein BB778_20565 [Pluralibacter gergoviae]|uniref:hypothetical protein n=1 Tax=Pluralibacter gergoviae TaxID=61647 RepID=UPI0008DC0BBA|nr:hypothetical protein [Pluralibacter gergoviae]OHY64419.1 hypothetical protein BB778_20565 [Pluralibacter gergoviae]